MHNIPTDCRVFVNQNVAKAYSLLHLCRNICINHTHLTKRIEKAFDKQNPKDKLMFHALNVGYTFEALMIAADAFKRARSTDAKTLAEAIRQTDIRNRMMLGGAIKFNAKGQVEGNASACIQNLNMRPTVVLPAAAAEAKPVFPVPEYRKA